MKANSRSTLDELAWEFFKTFSRAEYSLKIAGFCRVGRDESVSANWDAFADEIHPCITDKLNRPSPHTSRYELAKSFLLNQPPKKQIIIKGKVDWSGVQPSSQNETDLVLIYVRRVRNNLFHGGKFNGNWFAPERSEPLIAHSIAILDFCIKVDEDVNNAYHG